MKKYIKVQENEKNITDISIEIYYHKGGDNFIRFKQRGYYISVMPVTRENRGGVILETYGAFTGITQCIKPVDRKSARGEQEAQQRAAQIEQIIIDVVCDKNNIAILEV